MNTFKTLFIFGYLLFLGMGYVASGQSNAELRERVEVAREMSRAVAGELGVLREQTRRNTEDIRDLARIAADLTASMHRTNGIGIAVAGIGTIIIVMQMIGLKKKERGQ